LIDPSVLKKLSFAKRLILYVILPIVFFFLFDWNVADVLYLFTAELMCFSFISILAYYLKKGGDKNPSSIVIIVSDLFYLLFFAFMSSIIIAIHGLYPEGTVIGKEVWTEFLVHSLIQMCWLLPIELVFIYIRGKGFEGYNSEQNFKLYFSYMAKVLLPGFFAGIIVWTSDNKLLYDVLLLVLGRFIIELFYEKKHIPDQRFRD